MKSIKNNHFGVTLECSIQKNLNSFLIFYLLITDNRYWTGRIKKVKQVINLLGMLYLSCFLLAVGSHLNNIVIPLRLNAHGVETTWIGITMSANSLGLILGCIMGRKLVGRIGFVRTFVLSCTIFYRGSADLPTLGADRILDNIAHHRRFFYGYSLPRCWKLD